MVRAWKLRNLEFKSFFTSMYDDEMSRKESIVGTAKESRCFKDNECSILVIQQEKRSTK